jgi:hypothetical protein
MEEFREFKVTIEDDEQSFKIRKPENQDLMDSEFEYSREFNRAIMAGIMPEARIKVVLNDNGIWGEADEEEIADQLEVVRDLEGDLEEAETNAEEVALANELKDARDKLYALRQARSQLFSHSSEAKAESVQREFLVSRCTQFPSGVNVWKSLKEFRDDKRPSLVLMASYEFMTFSNGITDDFMDKLPENVVLLAKEKADAEAEAEDEPELEVVERSEDPPKE